MKEMLQLAVPTLFGLEGLCAEELRRLELPEVRAENGRVLCRARAEDIARINLNLRTGERVLLVLGSFPAGSFDALFEGTRALPWEEFVPREGSFPVKGPCPQFRPPRGARLSGHREEGDRRPAGGAVWIGAAARDRGPLPGAVFHYEGHGHPDAGYLGAGTAQAGLPGGGRDRTPAGDPGRRAGAAVPLPGQGPLLRPVLRLGHHRHRSRADRQKPGPGAVPGLLRPEVAVAGRQKLAGCRRRGHGQGIRRDV